MFCWFVSVSPSKLHFFRAEKGEINVPDALLTCERNVTLTAKRTGLVGEDDVWGAQTEPQTQRRYCLYRPSPSRAHPWSPLSLLTHSCPPARTALEADHCSPNSTLTFPNLFQIYNLMYITNITCMQLGGPSITVTLPSWLLQRSNKINIDIYHKF